MDTQQQQTAVVVPQDTLDAQRMNKKHWSIEGKQIAAKIEAASLGDDLIAKKGELKHGEFKTWIEANCEFSYAAANQYMKVAKAKIDRAQLFEACTSIREVLDLGKKPKEPKPKVEPDEADLKTIGNLQALAERGATEGERASAQVKLDAYTSAFGDQKEEVIEAAKKEQKREPLSATLQKMEMGMKRKGFVWMRTQLMKAMARDVKTFKAVYEDLCN